MSAFRFYYRGTKDTGNLSLRFLHGNLDTTLKTPYQSKREYWVYRSTKNGKSVNKLKKLNELKGTVEVKKHKLELTNFRDRLENHLRQDLNNGLPITKEWFKNAIEIQSDVLTKQSEISKAQSKINEASVRAKEIEDKNVLLNAVKRIFSKYQSNNDELKKFRTTYNWLKEYQKYKSEQVNRQLELKVSDFNQGFVDDFKYWAIEVIKSKVSTAVGHCKRIKRALIYAEANEEEGVLRLHRGINNLKFTSKREQEEMVDKIIVKLSFDEFDRIDDLDYTNDPKTQEVQKCMLIGSETGLRFSDFGKLNDDNLKTNLNGIQYWEFKTSKTKKWVQITKTDRLSYFLEMYGSPKTTYSDNEDVFLNSRMKEICKKAKINELIEMELNKSVEVNGKKVRRNVRGVYEKYKGITTRTLRRSFATNYYGLLDEELIMRVTGHTDKKSLREYINVHDDNVVEESFKRINEIHKKRATGLKKVE